MPEILEFTVHTVPVPQPRHRATAFGGKARMYLPGNSPVRDFKADLKKIARETYEGAVMNGPISLTCLFMMPRPKALIWKKRLMPRLQHDKKPDEDNIVKAVKDALNGILWRDDSQVWKSQVMKVYHAGDESPCVKIRVVENEPLSDWF